MVILITHANDPAYEWHAHLPLALKAGLRREIADAIAEATVPPAWPRTRRSPYDMATEILRQRSA